MALNYIWIAFFLLAFLVAVIRTVGFHLGFDMGEGADVVFQDITDASFSSAKTAFTLAINLTGILCLWLGLMRVGEKGGVIQAFSRLLNPFFRIIFPDIPKGHAAQGSILMNLSANMLGLDNAATPAGLKAMNEMQELNPNKERASNSQIMFLVLNTSGLTLIPVSIMADRSSLGAQTPSDIFIPVLLTTLVSTLVGLIAVSIKQRLNMTSPIFWGYIGGIVALLAGTIFFFESIDDQNQKNYLAGLISSTILFSIMIAFITMALIKKVNVFETFIDGAKEGFKIAIGIVPYLVGLLVGIAIFRASGALDVIMEGVRYAAAIFFHDVRFVDALPTALMKPLSGSGARALMMETCDPEVFGVDSFQGRASSIMRGATDTTFYVLAVYFGSVKIKNARYAVTYGLLADLAGIIAGVCFAYYFFG